MKSSRSILFVEDDAVVLTTYRNLLQREGFKVESAGDGLEALKALSQATPELIVLDLMLPKFDGADVLKFIRADPRLKTIPIIIFSNAQVTDFTEDSITKHLRKTDCTPSILLQTIQQMLDPAGTEAARAAQAESAAAPKLRMAAEGAPEGEGGNGSADDGSGDAAAPATAGVLKELGAEITKIRELCLAYIKAPTSAAKLEPLSKGVQSLAAVASRAGCARITLLAKAFEMLLGKIAAKPARVTPSILQTLAEAADCLGVLLKGDEPGSSETALRAKVLAVDDDTVCNHVIVNTLKRANLDITSVEDPFEGLKLLQHNRYDLVLLDIDMPKLTGFEVCEKLRALPQYKTTPVIFVTAHSNFGNRTQGVLSGGNYFITKPVDPLELALKVTIHLFKAQVNPTAPPAAKAEPKPEAKPKAAPAPEPPPKAPAPEPPVPAAASNGNTTIKAKAAEVPAAPPPPPPPPPKAQPRPAPPPEIPKPAPPTLKAAPAVSRPAPAAKAPPPELKSAPPIAIGPAKNGNGKSRETAPPPPAELSSAPPLPALNLSSSSRPRAASVAKVLPPPSQAPVLGESGTLNVNRLSGSRKRNNIMNNEQEEAFEKVVLAVVRIIFGDDNLTEMNIRLVRIALERYNVHEVINSPVAA